MFCDFACYLYQRKGHGLSSYRRRHPQHSSAGDSGGLYQLSILREKQGAVVLVCLLFAEGTEGMSYGVYQARMLPPFSHRRLVVPDPSELQDWKDDISPLGILLRKVGMLDM